MHITFPDEQPAFDDANLTVRFTARVDSEPVECGNYRRGAERSFRRPVRAGIRPNGCFRQRRNRICSVCAEAIDQNGDKGVVLHSGLFRVDGMEPDRGTTA
ncbi:DUF1488 family protein [Paraburkholderia sp. PGU19]|uniref:DUF1488 family protein n=1 Tax=Paraburkholderia sp. PGU19 TaxID=2735434 RepID=UPI001FB0658A|nr:DUF1488 family protein [Paraburkholderia sp. PGU19]